MDPAFEQALNDYIAMAVELERSDYRSDIEPFEVYARKLENRLRKSLVHFQKTYASGYELLFNEIKKRYPDTKLDLYKAKIDNLKLLNDEKRSVNFFAEGRSLYQLLGFSSDALLTFYEVACSFLESHRFKEAKDAFYFLVSIAPDIADYWLDLGYAYMQLGEFQAALESYERAIFLDPQNADGYLACCSTYLRMLDFEQAVNVCNIGLEFAEANSKEAWAEQLGSLLEEAKRQIGVLSNQSKSGAR